MNTDCSIAVGSGLFALLFGTVRVEPILADHVAVREILFDGHVDGGPGAGLVRRTVYPEVPVRVEYDLTADGDRLRPVVEVMREFGLWLKARDAAASCDTGATPSAAERTERHATT